MWKCWVKYKLILLKLCAKETVPEQRTNEIWIWLTIIIRPSQIVLDSSDLVET